MCGIVSIFSFSGEPIAADALDRATAKLAHRGPDGRKTWISPSRRAGLGHTRLSIIDLATGDQPLSNEDDTIHCVVNGEFYDYERVQRELTARGHRLRSKSDSEILLHLYEEVGTRALQDLRGEFAFVLWDENNQLLFAGRDRFGIKPIFYALHAGRIYLASEVKALLAAGVPAAWDHESVFQQLHLCVEQDRTLFHGIKQVPPGHYLVATRGHLRIMEYWDIEYPRVDELRPIPEEEQIARVRDTLVDAVRVRLRADVPVGCFLSGGVDSSTVFGIAAEQLSRPLKAFTVAFDEELLNEEGIARETAARLHADLQVLRVNQDTIVAHFADSIWHGESMVVGANGVAKYLLAKMIRDSGYKVMLSGEGSDEIFAGYANNHRDMVLFQGAPGADSRQALKDVEDLNKASRRWLRDAPTLPLEDLQRQLGFIPSWIRVRAADALLYRELLDGGFLAEFRRRDPYRIFIEGFDVPGRLAGREPVHQALYLWCRSFFIHHMLGAIGDRMEMAQSIEGRQPFLDHHLVAVASQIPASSKIKGQQTKFILREAAKPYVTETVYRRPKHPFTSPPYASQLNGSFSALVQDTLRSATFKSLPFFDHRAVVGLLDRVPSMNDDERTIWGPILTTLLCACILHERFALS